MMASLVCISGKGVFAQIKPFSSVMSRQWLGEHHHTVLQSVAATRSNMSQCQKVVATMLMAVLGGRENSQLHRRKEVETTSY